MAYNVTQALKDGLSEEEIVKHLATTRNYRLDDAIKAGVSHKEIIDYLAPQKPIGQKQTIPPPPPSLAITPPPPEPNAPTEAPTTGVYPDYVGELFGRKPIPDVEPIKQDVTPLVAPPGKISQPPRLGGILPPGYGGTDVRGHMPVAQQAQPSADLTQMRQEPPPSPVERPPLPPAETTVAPEPERARQLAWAEEAKATSPVVSTLKDQAALERPRGWTELSLPETLGRLGVGGPFGVKPTPKKPLSPEESGVRREKDRNILAIAKSTDLSPSFIEQNYDVITKELGVRNIPTTEELLGSLMTAAVGVGLIATPLPTIMGVLSFMGVKEAESLVTQILKGEKPKFLAGRELKEYLGPLEEHDQSTVDALEFILPGMLGAKVMSTTKHKLSGVLSKKIIHEAWEKALKTQYGQKLLDYKGTYKWEPGAEGAPPEIKVIDPAGFTKKPGTPLAPKPTGAEIVGSDIPSPGSRPVAPKPIPSSGYPQLESRPFMPPSLQGTSLQSGYPQLEPRPSQVAKAQPEVVGTTIPGGGAPVTSVTPQPKPPIVTPQMAPPQPIPQMVTTPPAKAGGFSVTLQGSQPGPKAPSELRYKEIIQPTITDIKAAALEQDGKVYTESLQVPPTAQHLEEMPEEYPDIKAAALEQDGKVYTDHTHANILVENDLDPERATPGFVTTDGEFIEQYPKAKGEEVEGKPRAWEGTAYRSEGGYKHDKGATAADVIRFEQEELGNQLGITDKTISELENKPATDVVWVTKTKEEADRYGGGAVEYEMIPGSIILATDNEGGYLVLKPDPTTGPALPKEVSKETQPVSAEATLGGKQIAFRDNEKGAGKIISVDGKDVGTVMLGGKSADRMKLEWIMLDKEQRGQQIGIDVLNKIFSDNPDINFIEGGAMPGDIGYWKKIGAHTDGESFAITRQQLSNALKTPDLGLDKEVTQGGKPKSIDEAVGKEMEVFATNDFLSSIREEIAQGKRNEAIGRWRSSFTNHAEMIASNDIVKNDYQKLGELVDSGKLTVERAIQMVDDAVNAGLVDAKNGEYIKKNIAAVPFPLPEVRKGEIKKAQTKLPLSEKAKEFFQPGNIIYSDYWKSYDKVLRVEGIPGEEKWRVQVERVDKNGNPIPGIQPRWHQTLPSKEDRIEKKGEVAPEDRKADLLATKKTFEQQLVDRFPDDKYKLDNDKIVLESPNKYTTLEKASPEDIELLQSALSEITADTRYAQIRLFSKKIKEGSDEYKKHLETMASEEGRIFQALGRFGLKIDDIIKEPTLLADAIMRSKAPQAGRAGVEVPPEVQKAAEAGKGTPTVETQEGGGGINPWELTSKKFKEVREKLDEQYETIDDKNAVKEYDKIWNRNHKNIVAEAYVKGGKIPDEVKKEYNIKGIELSETSSQLERLIRILTEEPNEEIKWVAAAKLESLFINASGKTKSEIQSIIAHAYTGDAFDLTSDWATNHPELIRKIIDGVKKEPEKIFKDEYYITGKEFEAFLEEEYPWIKKGEGVVYDPELGIVSTSEMQKILEVKNYREYLKTPEGKRSLFKLIKGKSLPNLTTPVGEAGVEVPAEVQKAEVATEPAKPIPFTKDMKITNLDQLPRGTGTRYLEVIKGEGDTLIAKRWRRSPVYPEGSVLIDMGGKKVLPNQQASPLPPGVVVSPPEPVKEVKAVNIPGTTLPVQELPKKDYLALVMNRGTNASVLPEGILEGSETHFSEWVKQNQPLRKALTQWMVDNKRHSSGSLMRDLQDYLEERGYKGFPQDTFSQYLSDIREKPSVQKITPPGPATLAEQPEKTVNVQIPGTGKAEEGLQKGRFRQAVEEVERRLSEEEPWGIEGKGEWETPIISGVAKKYGVPGELLRKHALWQPKKMGPDSRMPATKKELEAEGIAPYQLVRPPGTQTSEGVLPSEEVIPSVNVQIPGIMMAEVAKKPEPVVKEAPKPEPEKPFITEGESKPLKWADLPEAVQKNIPEELKDLRTEPYYGTQIIKGEKIQTYGDAMVTHTYDAKTGEELYQYALNRIEEKVAAEKRYEANKAKIAELPDVEGKKVEPAKAVEVKTQKDQKKYLIDAIDEAIKQAPDKEIKPVLLDISEESKPIMEKTPHVIIEVPGDGTFRVINSKKALKGFKEAAEKRFPAKIEPINIPGLTMPSGKPSGRRISPKEDAGYEYITEYSPKRVGEADYASEKALVGEGWFTNGQYAVKGSPPETFGKKAPKGKEPLTKKAIDQVIPSLKGMLPVTHVAEFHIMGSPANSGIAINDKNFIYFNPTLMDVIRKSHPDATPYIKDETTPIAFVKDKGVVGLLMPLRADSNPSGLVEEYFADQGVKVPWKVGTPKEEVKVEAPSPVEEPTKPVEPPPETKETTTETSSEAKTDYDSLFKRFKNQTPNQAIDYFEVEGHKVFKVEDVELPKGMGGTGLGFTNDAEGNIYLRKDLNRQGFEKALGHELRHHREKGWEETVNLKEMIEPSPETKAGIPETAKGITQRQGFDVLASLMPQPKPKFSFDKPRLLDFTDEAKPAAEPFVNMGIVIKKDDGYYIPEENKVLRQAAIDEIGRQIRESQKATTTDVDWGKVEKAVEGAKKEITETKAGAQEKPYTLDNPPKLNEKVIWRDREGVVDSAPSYALGTIRILDPIQGRVSVNISELSPVSPKTKTEGVTEEVAPESTEGRKPWKMTRDEIENQYPLVKKGMVDGRIVREHIPNQSSIDASVENSTILAGVREVSMSMFDDSPPVVNDKTKALAGAIKKSGEINPLIVVVDKEGPYVLEGSNRFDALKINGAKSIPAMIVLDEGSFVDAVKQALLTGDLTPGEYKRLHEKDYGKLEEFTPGIEKQVEEAPKKINAKTLTKEIESEPDYVYHATNEERLSEIADTGKLRTHKPGEFTEQDVWPDGSTKKRAYFSDKADIVWQFAPEEGRPVVIRTKGKGLLKESTGDVYSNKPISVDTLEYLGEDDNWHPVSGLKTSGKVASESPKPELSANVEKGGVGEKPKVGDAFTRPDGTPVRITKVNSDGTFDVVNGSTRMYLQELSELKPVTEEQFIESTKEQVAELRKESTRLRQEASDYNKSVEGRATERKGKVQTFPARIGKGGVDIQPWTENAESLHHRKLIDSARKVSGEADLLAQSIAPKVTEPKPVVVNMRTVKTEQVPGAANIRRITNIDQSVLDNLGWDSVEFEPGEPQKVFAISGGNRIPLFDGDVSSELIPFLKKSLNLQPSAKGKGGEIQLSVPVPDKVFHQSDTGELKLGKDTYGLGEGYFVSSKPLPKGFYGKKDITLQLKPETKIFDFQQWAKDNDRKLRVPQEKRAEIIKEATDIAKDQGYNGIQILPDDIWVFDKKSFEPETKDEIGIEFGKKIGGSKRDLWKERGLSLEDVKDMTLQERETYTKKSHVWPITPYEKFVEDGMSPGMAMLVKKIKDSISIQPEIPRTAQADPKLREEAMKRYIELVSRLREELPKVRSLDDLKKLKQEMFPAEKVSEYSSHYTDQANKDLMLLGGKAVSSAMQPRNYDLVRALERAEKTGFPAKQEAWQKQYDIHASVAGTHIYRNGKDVALDKDSWFVTKKGGHSIIQENFSSREEAEAWAKDQAKAKGQGEHLQRPFRENIERTGPDYRKGKNKTGDEILSEFNFRGGEFGTWTNQADRQQSLNEVYDALMDLADTLKVPPKALSLNGELGIAFGARGSGSASAHYEPGRVVINLTKTRGVGSLSHEFGHAVDDYFGRMATGGLPGKYVSHGAEKVGGARKEMLDAWANVMKAISDRVATKETNIADVEARLKKINSNLNGWLRDTNKYLADNPKSNTDAIKDILAMIMGTKPKQWNGENVGPQELVVRLQRELGAVGYKLTPDYVKGIGNNAWSLEKLQVDIAKAEAGELVRTEKTDFLKNALERGKGKSNNYWARKHELFARAFESFIEDAINETGHKSDYLVHSTNESQSSPWGAIYPHGRDRVMINKAFKSWVDTIRVDKNKVTGVEYIYEPKGIYEAKTEESVGLQAPKGSADYARSEIETTFPQVISSKSGSYDSGITHVNNASDAAHIGAINLIDIPQEHFISIITDNHGKVLSIYRHTVGTHISALVDQKIIIGQALNTAGAKHIWTVHNHPSGSSKLSFEDHQMYGKMENLARESGLQVMDAVSVGNHTFETAKDVSGDLPKIKPYVKLDFVERKFKKKGTTRSILNKNDLRTFVEKYLPEGGLVLADGQNSPVSVIVIDDLLSLRGEKQRMLVKEMEKRNASAMFVYEPSRKLTDLEIDNVFKFANASSLALNDVVDSTGSKRDRYTSEGWDKFVKAAGHAFRAVPFILPFLMGGGEEKKKGAYEQSSYLPPGFRR